VLRKSATDQVSFEKFVTDEAREMNNAEPHKQNLKECIQRSDYILKNDGTLEELHEQVNQMLLEKGVIISTSKAELWDCVVSLLVVKGRYIILYNVWRIGEWMVCQFQCFESLWIILYFISEKKYAYMQEQERDEGCIS